MKPVPQITQCDVVGPTCVRLTFSDGFARTLDLLPALHGRIFAPLKRTEKFREVTVQDGTLTWPGGADICPSVLRYWCELGHVCSQQELDAHFSALAPAAAIVAETSGKYSKRR